MKFKTPKTGIKQGDFKNLKYIINMCTSLPSELQVIRGKDLLDNLDVLT